MKLHYIKEPFLEFGRDTHVCPRAGITKYDVYDTRLKIRRERVLVGAIGTSDGLSKLHTWIEKCSQSIPPKLNSRQPNLFVPFCGFNPDLGFKSSLVIDEEITRTLNNSDISEIIRLRNWNEQIDAAVQLYYRQAKFLAQNRVVDVITCVIPTRLYDQIYKPNAAPLEETLEDEDEQPDDILEANFRRALKAKAMHLGKPLQIVREVSLESNAKGQQDDATKAWNFCTALYYKTNQTVPWKLTTNINRPSASRFCDEHKYLGLIF